MEEFKVDKFLKGKVKVNVDKINVCQIVKVSAHMDSWF